jgi:ribosomal protein L23
LGLGGFVYFYEIKGTPQREEIKDNKQQIFSFKEDDVQSLTVKTKNQTLNLERTGKSDGSKWEIKSPEVTPASNAIVGYLMNLLVEGKSERIISIPANQLTEFSLDQPQATIDIKLKNQKTHQLILGKPDFNRRFMYAQADPPAKPDGNVNVLLVSTDFENAVNRELSEWKQLQPINDSVKPTPNQGKPTPANGK